MNPTIRRTKRTFRETEEMINGRKCAEFGEGLGLGVVGAYGDSVGNSVVVDVVDVVEEVVVLEVHSQIGQFTK